MLTETMHDDNTTDYVRQRILEFLGCRKLHLATCVNLSNSRGAKDLKNTVKPVRYLDYYIEYEKDFSRSLLDTDSLLIDLDIEYANFDFPAEPYLDRVRALRLQQPVLNTIRSVLHEYGIYPLTLMTGRGYHFIWKVKKTTNAFRRLAALGRLNTELMQRYELVKLPLSVGKAFCGAGLIMEYLTHRVRQRLGGNSEIPVQVLEVVVGPQIRGREIIALDISEYADPLDTRFIRVPFSNYLKPYWKPGIMTPETKDRLPCIFVAPFTGDDFESMVHITQDTNNMQSAAKFSSAVIPEMAASTESLICAYENSQLRTYHDYFYQFEPNPWQDWPNTYDRANLNYLPACVQYILGHPNDLLLSPGALRLVTAALLAADWHPRHIAGLIRSKYERDYGWLNEWYIYDAGTRADFYTRVFASLIHRKLDDLKDLNCASLKRAGLCRQMADCGTDTLAAHLSAKELAV